MKHELKVKTNAGPGVLTLVQQGRKYAVIGLVLNGQAESAVFGFRAKAGATVLDESSDSRQCLGITHRVQVGTTILDSTEMRAVCVEDIVAALAHVQIACYNPEEI